MNEVYFDGEKARQIIIERLGRANHSIVLAMFRLNDEKIIEQLNNKAENLQVKVILDDDNFNRICLDKYSKKISIHLWKGVGLQNMHHKFCLIDDEILLHGTRNYTYNAIQSAEDLKLTDSTELIDEYQKEIENIYNDERTSEYVRGEYDMVQSVLGENVDVSEENDNYIEKFAEEMQTTVTQIFDEYDEDNIRELGYKNARENQGNINSYKTYLINIFNDVSGKLTRDDHHRQTVLAQMEAVMNRYNDNVNEQKRKKVDYIKNEERIFIDHMDVNIQKNKRIIEERIASRNDIDALYKEKELARDHKEEDINSISRDIVVTKFWNISSVGTIIILILLSGLLSFYFSSAIWKIFYERSYVEERLADNDEDSHFIGELVDFSAPEKLWYYMSPAHASFGQIFFVLVLFIVSIKYMFKINRYIAFIMSDIVGLFVFDIVIAFVVSKQIGEVEALVSGDDYVWSIVEAINDPFLYLIFMFGALPLFASKMCVKYLSERYQGSQDYLVDREKAHRRKILERELRVLESGLLKEKTNLENLNTEIEKIHKEIQSINDYTAGKKMEFAESILATEKDWDKRLENLRRIFDGFRTSVEAGDRQLLKNLIQGRAAVYKSGWMRFLNEYFAQEQVNLRVNEIDLWQVQWEKENFA